MPNEAAKKVYIITNTMNIASQNALLKVLEEPPGGAALSCVPIAGRVTAYCQLTVHICIG